jgi:hypothetical protein
MPEILVIRGKRDIAEARRWLDRLSDLVPHMIAELVVKRKTRTSDQNAKMHAMLTDIAHQAEWCGIKLHKDDWKTVLVGGWLRERKEESRMVPNWQKTGIESLGYSTRKFSVDEMAEFITFLDYAGSTLGVEFRDKQDAA